MPTCQLIRGRGSPQIYSRVSLLYSIYKSDAALLIDCVARRRALLQLRFLQQLLAQTRRQRQRVGQLQSADANTTRVNCQLCRTCNSSCFCCCCCPFAFVSGSARDMFALASGSLQLFVFVCLSPFPNTLTPHSHSPTLSLTTIKYR